MSKSELRCKKSPVVKSAVVIPTADLARHIQDWLFDCQCRQHSSRTLETRSYVLGRLIWFLKDKGYDECDTPQLRQFFAYLTNGHQEPSGRWNNPHLKRPMRPVTVHMYYNHIRTCFSWLVSDGTLETSPMGRIAPPIARPDQIQPFTPDQIAALLRAARSSRRPRRDEALVLFLLDTGLRCSELINLKVSDVDFAGRRCTVLGKGNKRRTIFFGCTAAKSLAAYLRREAREPNSPLFRSDRGDQPLTRSGLFQVVQRLGVAAGIKATRCSPHTFRHTYAIESLRAGANIFGVKAALGHESLAITNRYVAIAQADCEAQAKMFSPADRLKIKKR